MILLTSFERAAENEWRWEDVGIWSAAVYQPKWLPHRQKADWMDIRPTSKSKWIRPRLFLDHPKDPLVGYFDALLELYESRRGDAERWVEVTALNEHTWVCCWCPYDKAAQRQIEEWGTFVCHTAAVGLFLERMGLPVVYDQDRGRMERADGYTTHS